MIVKSFDVKAWAIIVEFKHGGIFHSWVDETVSRYRPDAIKNIIKLLASFDEHKTWRQLYREGYRAIKVNISPKP